MRPTVCRVRTDWKIFLTFSLHGFCNFRINSRRCRIVKIYQLFHNSFFRYSTEVILSSSIFWLLFQRFFYKCAHIFVGHKKQSASLIVRPKYNLAHAYVVGFVCAKQISLFVVRTRHNLKAFYVFPQKVEINSLSVYDVFRDDTKSWSRKLVRVLFAVLL